jgi:hypothetical protein
VLITTLSTVSEEVVLEESRMNKPDKNPGGLSWLECPQEGGSLRTAKVEKDVLRQAYLVNIMQQEKPAQSRQKSGAWTPSEGKSAKVSEELCGDDCGNKSPIRRKMSLPSNTSPHSGGKNSVKARICTRAATAIAIKEGNVKKKLKIPKDRDTKKKKLKKIPKKRDTKKKDASKSSQDGSGTPTPDSQTLPKKALRNPPSFTDAKEKADAVKKVQL